MEVKVDGSDIEKAIIVIEHVKADLGEAPFIHYEKYQCRKG